MGHGAGAFVLGLDLGSSSCKVCALDTSGCVLGSDSEAYATLFPQPSWAEQDPAVWLPSLGTAAKRLLARLGLDSEDVLGLSVTCAAHIAVLLDADRKVLRHAILWSDQRSTREAQAIAAAMGEEVLRISNNWPTPTWTLAHLAWLQKHEPHVLSRARHILLSKDYIAFLLTGRLTTDPSAAVSAMLMDVHTGAWSPQLCERVGIDRSVLPEILPTAAQIGTITRWGAQALGISERAMVFNGSMDSTAETFAAGVRDSGQFVIRLASAGGLHVIANPALARRNLISYPYCGGPFWLSQAGTNTCATAVSWSRDVLSSTDTVADFSAWTELASQSPAGSNGVMFHPYLSGERCPYWDADLRAAFTGLSLHSKTSDMARAVYEGTAYALRDAASVIETEGLHVDEVKVVGGGANSPLWTQTIANVFDCPVLPMTQADSSAGAGLYTLVGLGAFSRFEQVPPNLLRSDVAGEVLPETNQRAFFKGQFERYRFVQKHVSAISGFGNAG